MRAKIGTMLSKVPDRLRHRSFDRSPRMPPGAGFALVIIAMVSVYVAAAALIIGV